MGSRLSKPKLNGHRRNRWISISKNATVADQLPFYHVNATRTGGNESSSRGWGRSETGSADNILKTADSLSSTPPEQLDEPGPWIRLGEGNTPPLESSSPTPSPLSIGQTSPSASKPSSSRSDQPDFDTVDTRNVTCQGHRQEPSMTVHDGWKPPANYEALFPWAPPKYSYHSIGPTQPRGPRPSASRSEKPDDPIVAAARHNQTRPLHALPDGILLGILEHLDNTGVECLRRVSRRFPPLAAEVVSSRNVLPSAKNSVSRHGPFPWPRLSRMKTFSPDGRALLRLLDRDRYCPGCLRAREAPDWLSRVCKLRTFHWCSACHVFHPACLFSPAQRRRQPPDRKCVAHEGYIRICAHSGGTVRWSDVLDIFNRERAADPPAFNGRRCTDIGHVTVCGEPDREIDYGEYPSIHVTRELDPSSHVTNALGSFPRKIERLVMSWRPHIPLGPFGEWPPTASTLRRRLNELSDNAGRFMTLTTQPQLPELLELRCFDPNECDCVYFEGSEDVEWRPYRPVQQVISARWNPDDASSKCYLDPARRLVPFPGRSRLPPSTWYQFRRDFQRDIIKMPIRRCKPDTEKCLVAEPVHRFRVRHPTRKSMHGPGKLSIDARLCHSEKPCIRLQYNRTIIDRLPVDRFEDIPESWYQSLDPDSYGLTEDADGYGVYWCREPQCCNYYRGSPGFNRLLSGYRHLQGEVDSLIRLRYHEDCDNTRDSEKLLPAYLATLP